MAFATEGCTRIAICDRDTAGLAQTRALIEEKQREASRDRVEVEVITGNVASEESVAKMVQTVVQRWGRIDYAVNSAGIHISPCRGQGRGQSGLTLWVGTGIQGPPKRSTEFEVEEFDSINSVNYRGLWLCSRAQLTQMLTQEPLYTHDGRPGNRGAIVHVASQLGIVSRSHAGMYIQRLQ